MSQTDLSEDEESIISNTIAEISVILILIFFLALGLNLKDNKNVGEGLFYEEGIMDQLAQENCLSDISSDRRSLVLYTDAGSRPVFPVGKWQLTEFGRTCLRLVCTDLLNRLELPRNDNLSLTISILGHSSSEWEGENKICYYGHMPGNTARQGSACEFCGDDFGCNMRLSSLRAEASYQFCRQYTPQNNDETNLDNEIARLEVRDELFKKSFFVAGKSSAEPIIFNGTEDRIRSRRVEFAIRSKPISPNPRIAPDGRATGTDFAAK